MSIKLKHSLWKDNTWYFRRRIPDAIQPQLKAMGSYWAGKKEFLQCLNTPDPAKAERLIAKLKRQTDEEWSQLQVPTRAGTRLQAQGLLQDAGIDPTDPKADPLAYDVFLDHLDDQIPGKVKAEWQLLEELHGVPVGEKELARHLPAAAMEALRIVQGKQPEFLASDALDQYIVARCKSERAISDAKRAFKYLTDFLGDKDVRAYRKPKVNEFVQHLRSGGHSEDGKPISTTTVQRYLNTLKAAFGRALRENELGTDADNVFAKVEIPGKGDDVEKRESFTVDQYKALYAAIDQWSQSKGPDQLRCILSLVAATGARISEIAGLAVSDIHLKAEVPYIDIQPHPWRSLKNRSSTRKVPLTHTAIEALKVAKGLAGSSAFLFPNYCSEGGCKGDSASGALVSWVRTRPELKETKLGNHSLRHGLKDLLRAVGCPSEAADRIIGHKTPGMGAGYGGVGYPPEQLRDWLEQAEKLVNKD
ncbi:tyrosine-type recombinase/integrase [Cupriavidus basilensis]|uniref:tyrosine-type recombinase/integrase n=1 Tax=Cupriavidus basilensis TaxID=68895 RepID=UPI0023E85B47|nr:tyrosine-type recombinase/integrase [Cupriavidus basilensis]MDF3889270.1 tyrosine-type recombinase/integrase [Cupriavidus basilensis]